MDDKGSMVLATMAIVFIAGLIGGAFALIILGARFPI